MAADVRAALAQKPPSLPSKLFYDERGSQLFEAITRLPEYYQTRTEEALLARIAEPLVSVLQPVELLELGAGVARKLTLLLDSMWRRGLAQRCLLLDVDDETLRKSVAQLHKEYPGLQVAGVVTDFAQVDGLRALKAFGPHGRRLVLFLGGTLGNLHPTHVPGFLARIAAGLEPGDALLVGLDLVKDPARLEAAYNDAAGVTAQFNLNILNVLNERMGADFDLSGFEHVAFYDAEQAWIEMRLRALRPMRVRVPGARLTLRFERGDILRTELSCKYTRASFVERLRGTGLRLADWYTDPERLFALALLTRTTPPQGR